MIKRLVQLSVVALFALPFTAHAQASTLPDSAHRTARAAARRDRREDAKERAGTREAHPAIRAAIRSLERAKTELEHASHDFGGHRVDAIRSIDESLKQLRLALQYDKR